MPRVPVYEQQVAPQEVAPVYQSTDISPDAFGAGLGRAAQEALAPVVQAAAKIQEDYEETRVREELQAGQQAFGALKFNPEKNTGYLTRGGSDAVAALKEAEGELKKLREAGAGKMPSERARRAFEKQFSQYRDSEMGALSTRAVRELAAAKTLLAAQHEDDFRRGAAQRPPHTAVPALRSAVDSWRAANPDANEEAVKLYADGLASYSYGAWLRAEMTRNPAEAARLLRVDASVAVPSGIDPDTGQLVFVQKPMSEALGPEDIGFSASWLRKFSRDQGVRELGMELSQKHFKDPTQLPAALNQLGGDWTQEERAAIEQEAEGLIAAQEQGTLNTLLEEAERLGGPEAARAHIMGKADVPLRIRQTAAKGAAELFSAKASARDAEVELAKEEVAREALAGKSQADLLKMPVVGKFASDLIPFVMSIVSSRDQEQRPTTDQLAIYAALRDQSIVDPERFLAEASVSKYVGQLPYTLLEQLAAARVSAQTYLRGERQDKIEEEKRNAYKAFVDARDDSLGRMGISTKAKNGRFSKDYSEFLLLQSQFAPAGWRPESRAEALSKLAEIQAAWGAAKSGGAIRRRGLFNDIPATAVQRMRAELRAGGYPATDEAVESLWNRMPDDERDNYRRPAPLAPPSGQPRQAPPSGGFDWNNAPRVGW